MQRMAHPGWVRRTTQPVREAGTEAAVTEDTEVPSQVIPGRTPEPAHPADRLARKDF